jgi:DNA-binding NarL/FixJ family response regulator
VVAVSLDERLSDAANDVIPLLAAGLNDKAIAHEAGMSATTLNRRIAELMKSFGTRTRFQLGWRAALNAFPEGTSRGANSAAKPKL